MIPSATLRTLGLAFALGLAMAEAGALPLDGTAAVGGGPAEAVRTAPEEAGEPPLRFAQGNCSAAAAQAAAQTGGQVLSVSSRNEGGQTVCVVTVLVPGQDGGRPRRTTITVPG